MRPDNLQIVGGPESLNTSRTEIAPRSHVVRENFQRYWLWHSNTLGSMVGIFDLAGEYSNLLIYCSPTATRSSRPHLASLQPAFQSLSSQGCR